MMRSLALALGVAVSSSAAIAQMAPGMEMKASAPSTALVLTGLTGKTKTLTPAELKAMPHVTVQVHNAHNNKDERYRGVPVQALLALVEPAKADAPKVSSNMLVVVAGATDNFHVVVTLCDVNAECRKGQAIVADVINDEPLAAEGAFKLVLTEDKKPARWTRNLASLTVKAVTP